MNIAVFGGSFDPPHIGHEEIVRQALRKLDIGRLLVVPAWRNPFKRSFRAPPALRYAWVKKLLSRYPRAKVCDYEMRQNRPVPTIETIRYLKKIYRPQKIYLIIGADNLASLHRWHDYEKLASLVTFVVATREGVKIPENLQKLDIHVSISSTELRRRPRRDRLPANIADDILAYYYGHKEKDEPKNRKNRR